MQDNRPLTLGTKVAYGFGAVAYGIKDTAFSTFLLFFYSRVIGMPAEQVGFAIMLVLIIDAISDPLVGHVSDNLHSRWGRRHPFMYFSALPVAVSFFLMWNPPDLSNEAMFFYLLIMAALVRTLITLFEVPSTSLIAELTSDYDERTKLVGYRGFFGYLGGLGLAVIAYTFFFPQTEKYPVGLMNPAGYTDFSALAAITMFVAILVSSIGTHNRIPTLKSPPPKRPFNARQTANELKQTLSNRSFLALMGATVFGSTASGLNLSSANFLFTLFWEFTSEQIGLMNMFLIVSVFIAVIIAPRLSRRIGKKKAAIFFWFTAASLAPLPYLLRVMGLFPDNGSPALLPTVLGIYTIDMALFISANITISSMFADIVEDSEKITGRRSEGIFFASRKFLEKSVSGLGIFMASTVLVIVGISETATPGSLDQATLTRWALVFAPTLLCLYMTAIALVFRYRIDRETHEQNLRQLAEEHLL
ncbi:MAG: MFS transporter [Anderseniella sp.]|jgi:Na+/melibiose symporter-like transporter|nr:MFS transporter [Anderseniella sp.]